MSDFNGSETKSKIQDSEQKLGCSLLCDPSHSSSHGLRQSVTPSRQILLVWVITVVRVSPQTKRRVTRRAAWAAAVPARRGTICFNFYCLFTTIVDESGCPISINYSSRLQALALVWPLLTVLRRETAPPWCIYGLN